MTINDIIFGISATIILVLAVWLFNLLTTRKL
jgi:hypothetical protein